MAYPANDKRNKELVALRRKSPKKYTYQVLGDIFKIKRETAHNIFKRETARS